MALVSDVEALVDGEFCPDAIRIEIAAEEPIQRGVFFEVAVNDPFILTLSEPSEQKRLPGLTRTPQEQGFPPRKRFPCHDVGVEVPFHVWIMA